VSIEERPGSDAKCNVSQSGLELSADLRELRVSQGEGAPVYRREGWQRELIQFNGERVVGIGGVPKVFIEIAVAKPLYAVKQPAYLRWARRVGIEDERPGRRLQVAQESGSHDVIADPAGKPDGYSESGWVGADSVFDLVYVAPDVAPAIDATVLGGDAAPDSLLLFWLPIGRSSGAGS
jgi:hypothetical protein